MKSRTICMKTFRNYLPRVGPGLLFAVLIMVASFHAALAQTAPSLGSAQSFAVLGGQTVTNTGPTIITGDLGVSPGTAVTGFPPGTVVGGTIHAADQVAAQAQADTTQAYNVLAGEACGTTYGVPKDIVGLTLVPGVYCFASSAGLTGALTLDARGDTSAVWVFEIGSTLITGSNASVTLINGAQQCNVFWQVGSSATLGTGTQFVGNILALTSISLTTNATLSGRALARNGAVTMDSNTVSVPACGGPPSHTPPTLSKAFSPATIAAGGDSTLILTLSNADVSDASMTSALTDTLPAGVVIAGTATSTCGGTATASPGGSTVTLTGGTIPAGGSCTVTVNVTAPSGGSFLNSLPSGALQTSNGGNSAPAVATLTVNAPVSVPPTLNKAFSPATIPAGGSSILTLTLNNTDAGAATLSAPFTDYLPTGVVVSNVPNASTTCGGALTATKGSSFVTLTGGAIQANGSCTVTVSVTVACAGSYFNSLPTGALQTSNGGNAAPAVATILVSPTASTSPKLTKYFYPDTIKAGGVTTLTIALNNPSSTVARLTMPLIDHLPTGVVVSGTASTTCGGAVIASKGSSTVTLTGGSIPANGSCKVTVPVTAKSNGKYYNSIPARALGTSQGSNATPATATLYVNATAFTGPRLTKSFGPTSIQEGGVSILTITLSNTDSGAAKLTAPLIDHLPAGMIVSGSASDTCGGSVTATKGSSTVTLTGGSIPANGSCRLTVPVTVPMSPKCACGSYYNSLHVGALQTSNGSNTEPTNATLTVHQ